MILPENNLVYFYCLFPYQNIKKQKHHKGNKIGPHELQQEQCICSTYSLYPCHINMITSFYDIIQLILNSYNLFIQLFYVFSSAFIYSGTMVHSFALYTIIVKKKKTKCNNKQSHKYILFHIKYIWPVQYMFLSFNTCFYWVCILSLCLKTELMPLDCRRGFTQQAMCQYNNKLFVNRQIVRLFGYCFIM